MCKKLIVLFLVVVVSLCSSVSAYTASRNFSDNFNGFPLDTITNWDAVDPNTPGAYNGLGQYVLEDTEAVLRNIEVGSFEATLDLTNFDIRPTTEVGTGAAGYFNLLLLDTSYRLHVSIVNINDGTGDNMSLLGDTGAGYAYWSSHALGDVTSLSLKYQFDAAMNTVSLWAAVNGGPMQIYVDHQASHTAGNAPMLEQIYVPAYYPPEVTDPPGLPTVALDNYVIEPVPEPATIALLGLGLTLIRRKR